MNVPNEVIKRIREAGKIVVLTGAGVSAESGISTFRDKDGWWSKYDPTELASPSGFERDPALVWQWYQYRRGKIRDNEPNAGHYALSELERMTPEFTLITQNVDRYHQQAGSKNIIELHGNIIENKCYSCGVMHRGNVDEEGKEPENCEECGGLIRPNVVWFGESLPHGAIERAQEETEEADIFMSIGTSAMVYPAAELPMLAKRSGVYAIEINSERTVISDYMDMHLHGKSGEILKEIVDKLKMEK